MEAQDHTHIIKGKRTKRQRPQSPIPFVITALSPVGEGGGDGRNHSTLNTNFSPTTSGEFLDSTEEEEDMAHCLILLAQGHSRGSPKRVEEDDAVYRAPSRRYLEAAVGAGSKVGLYVYECKTCNRTFPSFQALGGHRASHKKPKAMADERKNFVLSDEEEGQFRSNSLPPLSLQLSTRALHNSNRSNKLHECSICGAEFTSGQALGGHMRRHRGLSSVSNNNTNTTLSLSPIVLESEEAKKPRNLLSLDLNLPAPEDDHHRESKFAFASKQQQEQEQEQHQQQQQQQQQQKQQQHLVFSTPTLVDCHY